MSAMFYTEFGEDVKIVTLVGHQVVDDSVPWYGFAMVLILRI